MRGKNYREKFDTMSIREVNDDMYLEGYFITFNDSTELFPGCTESINRSVADNIVGDIRALINHDFSKVLGRTSAGTLELRADNVGVYGKIKINPKDSDAVNLYERVKRRDVTGNSFGFDIIKEEQTYNDDGTVHYDIQEIKLHEVSVVTFPVYENTSINAREIDVEKLKVREFQVGKDKLLNKIKGVIG